MMHDKQQNDTDIAEQKHIGTHPGIAALGYGAVETKIGLIGGMVPGAILGALIGEPIVNAEAQMQKSLDAGLNKFKGKGFINGISTAGLKTARWVVTSSNHVADWLLDVMPDGLETKLRGSSRFRAGVAGTAFGAIIGFLGATILGGKHGWDEASASKKQFRTAQEEIKLLREEKDALLEDKAKRSAGLADGEEIKPIDPESLASVAPHTIAKADAQFQGRIAASPRQELSA